jgi:hypothetical protein
MSRLATLAVALLAAVATAAHADTLVVTDTSDDVDREGSLRSIIASAAEGDTIEFELDGPIRLRSDLEIRTPSLLIRGPATIRAKWDHLAPVTLTVAGDSDTLQDLTIEGLTVHVADGTDGAWILGCAFREAGSKLFVGAASGTRIGNVLQPNTFDGMRDSTSYQPSVMLVEDVETTVEGNSFRGPDASVWSRFSTDLRIAENHFVDAGIEASPDSAVIENNRIRLPRNGRRGNGIFVLETPERAQPGLVEVIGNRVNVSHGMGAIDVGRSNAVIRDNRVRAPRGQIRAFQPASGIGVGAGHPYHPTAATVLVEGNRVRGSDQGISVFAEEMHSPAFVVRDNVIRHVRGIGLSVRLSATGSAVVRGNRVRRGRGDVERGAMQVFLASTGAELTFEGNRVTKGTVPAVEISLSGGSALIQDNRLARGASHAIRVRPGTGTAYVRANVIERHPGDAVRFETNSRGVVTLVGSIIERIGGVPLFVADGADVQVLD